MKTDAPNSMEAERQLRRQRIAEFQQGEYEAPPQRSYEPLTDEEMHRQARVFASYMKPEKSASASVASGVFCAFLLVLGVLALLAIALFA